MISCASIVVRWGLIGSINSGRMKVPIPSIISEVTEMSRKFIMFFARYKPREWNNDDHSCARRGLMETIWVEEDSSKPQFVLDLDLL